MHRRAGNSPDLNPIEYVWSIKNARLKRDHTITFLPKLERAIKMMWVRDLSLFLFQKLAHSMPTKIKKCLENKSHMIKS
jgi:transposase